LKCKSFIILNIFFYTFPPGTFALGHFLSRPEAKFGLEVRRGYQETEFLKHLVALDELEPLCKTCVLVWHTRTKCVQLDLEEKLKEKGVTLSYHNFEV
jgi:hypothetical protein